MSAEGCLIRVGEVAERLGVSPRTVKYYEELGLVEPGERSAGGFRLYGGREIERLERILQMKSIGYSLAAIRELLAARDRAQEADRVTVLGTAAEHLREREQEASELLLKIREDLRRAESLREELGRDIALCERRMRELGGPG
ncbi:MAG TPA: MerR family transcriptional regulator [Rubrobacter sp.]|nr:MerR family transcriptional regulator [Rubrobacter sp.]